LLKNEFSIRFLEFTLSLNQPQQITTTGIFHDHEEMLTGFKHLQKSDYVGVLDLFEQIDFLEDLSFAKIILHIVLLDRFNSNLFTCKFMDTKCDLAKCSFSD